MKTAGRIILGLPFGVFGILHLLHGPAMAGYVPAFIAVNYVMTHPEEHNLYPIEPRMTYADLDTVNVKAELSFQQIAKVLDMPVEDIQYLNPCYKRCTVPHSTDECYSLRLPVEKIGIFIANEDKIYEYAKKDSLMQSLAVQEIAKTHVVRKGETISKVAKRYGCTPEDVKAWNHLKSVKLHTGQKLTVFVPVKGVSASVKPAAVSSDTTAVSKAKPEIKTAADTTKTSSAAQGKFKYVTVEKGDSLWSIAQENNVSIDQIKNWNSLEGGKIFAGQKIKILISE